MKRASALVVLAVAVGAAAWILGRPSPRPVADPDGASPSAVSAPPPLAPGDGPTFAARAPTPTVAPSLPPRTASGPIEVPTGSLHVVLVPPEGKELPKDVRVDVDSLDLAYSGHPLPMAEEDGSWTFAAIQAGRHRVRVHAAGFRDASDVATVSKGERATTTIRLALGAVAEFKVTLWNGDAVPSAHLALLDARGLPIEATFRTPVTWVRSKANDPKGVPSEPTGAVIGLKPGRYTLRATSDEGEVDEQPFEARLDDVPRLELRVKR